MNWQQVAAQVAPVWTGDLYDDCTAHWAGLTLRAEWMDGDRWWWCVYDDATGDQVITSDRPPQPYRSGQAARVAAEQAARRWLGLS